MTLRGLICLLAALGAARAAQMHHGLVIDAGSGGSRIHVFEWEPRIFDRLPPPLSRPVTQKQWSARLAPGISSYADDPMQVAGSLTELLDFGKAVLAEYESDWAHVPIYLKATGGMRELDTPRREAVMDAVRELLGNKTFCPFKFRFDYARVLSGEEEGAFGWIAANAMLERLQLFTGDGSGAADPQTNVTVGALDLGGASTQISFFRPEQDILANLYKVQLGQEKHWNIYSHSFLWFGRNSAYDRQRDELVAGGATENPCLQAGWTEEYGGVTFTGTGNWTGCRESIYPLLHKSSNQWCDFSHSGQCSFAGVYQPPLYGTFLAINGYAHVLDVPGVEVTSDLVDIESIAGRYCGMTAEELEAEGLSSSSNYCWIPAYIVTLLNDGYGFPMSDTPIEFTADIDGSPVGWPVGSMLYELNTQGWRLAHDLHCYSDGQLWLVVGIAVATMAVWPVLAYRGYSTMKRRASYTAVP